MSAEVEVAEREQNLKFNHEESYAVCCFASEDSFGEGAYMMRKVFSEQMGIPACELVDLRKKTKDDAKKMLKKCAEKAKKDGILVLTISCHGDEDGTLAIDFEDSNYDKLTFRFFESCLKNATVGKVVLILDCCFGGKLASSLVKSSTNLGPGQLELYITAAAGPQENTWYFQDLQCAVFPYFLVKYLEKHGRRGEFPMHDALDHAQKLCPALVALKALSALPVDGVSPIPYPVLEFKCSGAEGSVEPRYERDAPLTADCLNFFLSDDGKYENLLPQKLHEWFQSTAIHSVRVLFQHGYLKRGSSEYEEMAICVLCLLAESAAKIVSDAHCCDACVGGDDESAVSCDDGDLPATPGNADVFLQVGRYFLWLFEEAVHGSDGYDIEEKPQVLVRHLLKTLDRYKDIQLREAKESTNSVQIPDPYQALRTYYAEESSA